MYSSTEAPLFRLPNGATIQQANPRETLPLYRQIYEDRVYFKHGISLPENAVVVDAGANIGLFSRYVIEHYSISQLVALEPAPRTFRLLQANTCACRMARVYNCGLGGEDVEMPFTYLPRATCGSGFYGRDELQDMRRRLHLAAEKGASAAGKPERREQMLQIIDETLTGETIVVPMWSLGALIARSGIARIDLLKLDIEGCECDAVRAIRDEHWSLISQFTIEVHDSPKRLPYLMETLSARGFAPVAENVEPFHVTQKSMLYARRASK